MKWLVSEIIFLVLSLLSVCINVEAANDSDSISADTSSSHYSHYDQRIHRYRRHWASLIPTQHVIQFAGNMGLASVGMGWDYGKHRQWETHLLIGFIPKYDSHRAKITMTLKENYIPWSVNLNEGWNLEPLECGLYFNTVFGHEFWGKQPAKYDSGYYPFSTKFRPNIFIGQRITKTLPNNRRRYIKSITAFYELGTCDIYFMTFYRSCKVEFWDVMGLSLGLKMQLL